MEALVARLTAVFTALTLLISSAAAQRPGGYVYSTLTSQAQEVYDRLWEGRSALEERGELTWEETVTAEEYDALLDGISQGVESFCREHPELFWLEGGHHASVRYTQQGSTRVCTFTLTLPFRAPWSTGGRSIQEDKAALEDRAARLAEEAGAAGESRYARLAFLHDWLTHHNEYNDAAQLSGSEGDGTSWTALSALDEGMSPVCEGYAKAFYLLCAELDVPCLLQNNGEHMWNLVQMEDGGWYGVDVTYDDPRYTLNGVLQTGLVSGGESREHFLQGEETFRADHPLTAPEGPELSPTAYAGGVAYPSAQTVLVDGAAVEFAMYALRDEAGNDTNYVRLRDVAAALSGTPAQFDVGWSGRVEVTTGQAYTGANEKPAPFTGEEFYRESRSPTVVDGEERALSAILLTDAAGGGYTYYQLRDLGRALGFEVDWTAETGVTLSTSP